MSKSKLSSEEKELLDSVEAGNYESVLTESRRKELKSIAQNTFKKDKRINVRISNRDLVAIQSRASEEGMPYQTLVSSIIHKYISGSLQDITANKQLHRKKHSLRSYFPGELGVSFQLGELVLTWEILTKAFRYVYGYRMQLGKALLFPLSIMAAIGLYESDSESISWLSLITVFLAEILVYTVVAINTHRIILMGPPSVPEWGIFKPSKRELIFILYSISIGLITIPLSLFALIPIIGFPVAFLAIAYVIGRSSLVFPAVATDHRWTFSDSWRATKNYQILMMVIAVGFPIIMGLPEFLLGFFPHATMLAKIVSVLTFVFVVAALSIAFKAIANERNEN